LVADVFPTFTSSFLSATSSNAGKVKYWLKEYPVNPNRISHESRKFKEANHQNKALMFADANNTQQKSNGFVNFKILEDKIIIEDEESASEVAESTPKKKQKRLVPAKWDEKF